MYNTRDFISGGSRTPAISSRSVICLSDGNPELTREDEAGEFAAVNNPLRRDGEEVHVLAEQYSVEERGASEQLVVREALGSVVLRRNAVNAARPQSGGDCRVDVVIHVEAETQGDRLFATLSFESRSAALSLPTSSSSRRRRSWIRESTSS